MTTSSDQPREVCRYPGLGENLKPANVRGTEGSPVGGTAMCGMTVVAQRWRDPSTMSPDITVMFSLDPRGQQQTYAQRAVGMRSVAITRERTMVQ